MSILNKTLDYNQLNALELLLKGAFAPLEGYLNQADHVSVLQKGRLANGHLWPLPLSMSLSPQEKREAQLTGRVILQDAEARTLAEIQVEQLYRLPADIAQLTDANPDNWYVAGKVTGLGKVLHPAFNRIRHAVNGLRSSLKENGWSSVVAVQASPALDMADMHQACEWLKASCNHGVRGGGLLIQIDADEQAADFHQQIRALRSNIRCSAARQIKLSLQPKLPELDAQRSLLLNALIARNYGATGFVVSLDSGKAALRHLMQHRDEIGLDIIPVRHATANKVEKLTQQDGLLPAQQLEAAFKRAA